LSDPAQTALSKYVIFQIGQKDYALAAKDVKEIASDLRTYPLPFTPVWVSGVLNRLGEPYTIIDLNRLFFDLPSEGQNFILINRQDDQLALIVEEIQEILKIPLSDFHSLDLQDEEHQFFSGSLQIEGKEVFVINLDQVLERLDNDLPPN